MNDREMMKSKLERYRKLAFRAAELGKPDFAAALDQIADDYAKLLSMVKYMDTAKQTRGGR
jgi:hypothetical protein